MTGPRPESESLPTPNTEDELRVYLALYMSEEGIETWIDSFGELTTKKIRQIASLAHSTLDILADGTEEAGSDQ